MADTQGVIYAQTFGRNIMPLAQQKESKLYPHVWKKPNVDGKVFYQDRIGEWSMSLKAGRASTTPLKDPGFSRRMAIMQDYNDARFIDKEDDIKIISDPKSAMTMSASKSIGRTYDDVIITQMLGTAYAGETGTDSVVLPSAQKITASSANLTLAKVAKAKRIMDDNDVDTEDRIIVIGPQQLEALLNLEKFTSGDYNTVRALVRGEIDTFLGFKWIVSTRLPKASTTRSCFAFQKYALCFGEATGPTVRTDERSDLSYTWQVYYSVHIGAVRVEDERVVQIDCIE